MKAYKVLMRVDHVRSGQGWDPGDIIKSDDMPVDLNIAWLLRKKAVEEFDLPEEKPKALNKRKAPKRKQGPYVKEQEVSAVSKDAMLGKKVSDGEDIS